MQHIYNLNMVDCNTVNKYVIGMDYDFTGAVHPASPIQVGMFCRRKNGRFHLFAEVACRRWIVN